MKNPKIIIGILIAIIVLIAGAYFYKQNKRAKCDKKFGDLFYSDKDKAIAMIFANADTGHSIEELRSKSDSELFDIFRLQNSTQDMCKTK